MKLRIQFVALIWGLLALTACAGPSSPFGAIQSLWPDRVGHLLGLGPKDRKTVQIVLTPERQRFHSRIAFQLVIRDDEGVPANHQFRVFYNRVNITKDFVRQTRRPASLESLRELKFVHTGLRLPAHKTHHLRIEYQHDPMAPVYAQEWESPTCDPHDLTQTRLTSTAPFQVDSELRSILETQSVNSNFSPYFMAALVAQESAFNPKALSVAKALGLTQVTSLGEEQVMQQNASWPRYPGLAGLSLIDLKLKILSNKINETNEWRLNPDKSVRGGLNYLSYLEDYWNKPEKESLLQSKVMTSSNDKTQILLASYNSGAARVTSAINDFGKDWIRAQELSEARIYVQRILGFCDHFQDGNKEKR